MCYKRKTARDKKREIHYNKENTLNSYRNHLEMKRQLPSGKPATEIPRMKTTSENVANERVYIT